MIHSDYFDQEVFLVLRAHLMPGEHLFLVGGAVRDLLLGKTPEDLDFVIKGNAKKLSRAVADQVNGAVYQLDDEHAAMRVLSDCELFKGHVDISELRGQSLEEDLCDRDFTINAMAIDITNDESLEIVDPCQGQQDLEKGVIRACRMDSINSDPVRILRGIRLSLVFGFAIETDTSLQMKQPALLACVSAERKRDELFKIFEPNLAQDGFDLLAKYDLVPFLFPALRLEYVDEAAKFIRNLSKVIGTVSGEDIISESRKSALQAAFFPYHKELSAYLNEDIVEGRKRAILLFFTALAWLSLNEQDMTAGTGFTKKYLVEFCGHFALSNREMYFLLHIIENRNRVLKLAALQQELDGKTIYRFFRETDGSGIGLCILSLAQSLAGEPDDSDAYTWPKVVLVCQQLVHHYYTERENTIDPQVLINGDDLISIFSLTPGPMFHQLLEVVREEQAEGNINNRKDALSFIKQLLQEKKLGAGDK